MLEQEIGLIKVILVLKYVSLASIIADVLH